MNDVERLTREYQAARARHLSAKANRQAAGDKAYGPSALAVEKLLVARERAAIELADAIAGAP